MGRPPGQGEQHDVGDVAVVVHAHGITVRVSAGDHSGDAVEHGDDVQPLGQQPEALLRNRAGRHHVCAALRGCASGGDALFRGEVPALRVSPQRAQMERHEVHQPPLGGLAKPLSNRGDRNTPEEGKLLHGGQEVADSSRNASSRFSRRERSTGSGRKPAKSMKTFTVAASIARPLPPTACRTDESTAHPIWPSLRNGNTVWRATPKCSAAYLLPFSHT